MAYYGQSQVAPHFNHPDLRKAVITLMKPSLSCNAYASVNGITWPKRACCNSFSSLDLRNAIVSLIMPLAFCDTDGGTKASHDPNINVTPNFDHLDIKHVMVPLTVAINIMLFQCWCQRCSWLKKFMLHSILIILT